MRKPSQDVAVSGMSGYSAGRRAGGVSGRALVSPVQCDRRAACAATGLAAGHPRAQHSSQGTPLPHPLLAPRQRKRVTSVKQTGGDVVGSRARQPGRRGVHRAGPGHGRCSFPPFIRRRAGPHALRHSAAWRPTQRGAQPGTGGMGQGARDLWGQAPAHLHCPEAGRSHASVQHGQPRAASEAHGVPSCLARRSPAEKELVRRTGVALRAGRQGGHPATVTRPQATSPAASQEAVWPTRHHPHLCVHDGVTEANPRWPCVWHTLAFVAHDGRASTRDMCSDHTAGCSV